MEWFNWFWNLPPPIWWQWVLSIIAVIAFVGWLVNEIIHQLSRPRVRLHFHSGVQAIYCHIQNMPSRYLLRRDAVQSLTVEVVIVDIKAEEQDEIAGCIHSDKTARKIQFGEAQVEKKETIMLPASEQCASLQIVRASELKALASDENGKFNIELHPGEYRAVLIIQIDGKERLRQREFKVSQEKPYVAWEKDGTVKL